MRDEPFEIIENGAFYAGIRGSVLWGYRILRYPNGSIAVSLKRVGRRNMRSVTFDIREINALINQLHKIKEKYGVRS